MDNLEQLCGTVETITFQNRETGFAVLRILTQDGNDMTVTGMLADSVCGEEITLTGRFIEHSTYGIQFEATECEHRLPETESAMMKYLGSGVLPGIGKATARRIVKKFGANALEVLANEPEKLSQIQGISPSKAKEAGRRFKELFNVREAIVYLSRFGLSTTEALSVFRQYDASTIEVVKQNPYILCDYPLFISFARADAIASSLSMDIDSSERVCAAILYTLRHNLNNGHSALPKQKLLNTASRFFSIAPQILSGVLENMIADNELYEAEMDDVIYIYLPDAYRAEVYIAIKLTEQVHITVADYNKGKDTLEKLQQQNNLVYAKEQKEAILEAMKRNVLVITGGPGTGKTTTVNAILSLFEQRAGIVMLAAPTGRAAKRMSDLTGHKATTIHRLLEATFDTHADTLKFLRDEHNPLKCDVLIIDEMSMVDSMLFESLLRALRPNCRLIMVGDVDQLPSVGPGNVLRAIIDSGVIPVVALSHIFRQAASSLIITNAHRVVEGLLPQKGKKEDDFFSIEATGVACQHLVCELAGTRLPNTYEYSPFMDIQVLCPGRKGPLGTELLNGVLQQKINPPHTSKPELKWGALVYRLGDKVMQVRNNYNIAYTDDNGEPGVGIYNGDIGIIEEIDAASSSITVYSEGRHIYYTAENLRELELAYAVTIHKSQGSEYDAVIVTTAEVPQKLRYRNLLYTAITRAKKLCVVVGEEKIMAQMVNNARKNFRYTCLAQFLKDEIS